MPKPSPTNEHRRIEAESTAIPPSLRSLTEEPRWVDLQWFNQPNSLGRDDPRFTEVALQLFCPIHGIDRGDAVALRDANVRRARRLAGAAISALSALLVVAVISAFLAVAQMRTAQEQRDVATVRLLTAESQRIRGENVGLARLLAAQASSMTDDAQTRRTLFQSLMAGSALVGELSGQQPTAIATDKDATRVFLGDEEGTIRRRDVASRQVDAVARTCDKVWELQASDDGAVLTGRCGDDLEGFVVRGSEVTPLGEVAGVAVSPSGRTVAVLDGDGVHVREVTATGLGERTTLPFGARWGDVALRDDDIVATLDRNFDNTRGTELRLLSISNGTVVQQATIPGRAPEEGQWLSRTGEAAYDAQYVWRLPGASAPVEGPLLVSAADTVREFMPTAISEDGSLAVSGLDAGSVEATAPARAGAEVATLGTFETAESVGNLAVTRSRRVVGLHSGVVTVWDLGAASPAVHARPVQFDVDVGGIDIHPNRSGDLVALGDFTDLMVWNNAGEAVFRTPKNTYFLGWQDDRHFFAIRGGELERWSVDARAVDRTWPVPPTLADYGLLGGWSEADGLLTVSAPGTLLRFDPQDGEFHEIPLNGRDVQEVSPDASRILAVADDMWSVWDGGLERELFTSGEALRLLANGDATTVGSTVFSWHQVGAGQQVPVPFQYFDRLPVSPDGQLYLSTDMPGHLRVMTREGQEVGRLPITLFEDSVAGVSASAAFSGTGQRAVIVSALEDHGRGAVLTFVDFGRDTLLRAACESVKRPLTAEEYRRVTGSPPTADLVCA